MKNRHFVKLEEYHYFCLELSSENKFVDEDFQDLNTSYKNATSLWEVEIVSNNYFFAKMIDRLYKAGIDCKYLIQEYYELESKIFFSINECNEEFLELLMRHFPEKDLSIDENLNQLIQMHPNV